MKYAPLDNYINGSPLASASSPLQVTSPVNGEALSSVPTSTPEDLQAAVSAARVAFPTWSSLTLRQRCDVFYSYRNLLQENLEELALICHEENGKTMGESKAEVLKAIELTELACSLANMVGNTADLTFPDCLQGSKGGDCDLLFQCSSLPKHYRFHFLCMCRPLPI